MKNKVVFGLLFFCVALAVSSNRLSAQGEEVENRRIGTASATELLIPVGARDLAMGGASLATTWGSDAVYWNPAGLGRIQTTAEATLTTMAYIADIRTNYGAVGVNFGGFGVVALSVKALNFGDIPLTTNDDPEGLAGRTYSPSFVTVGFSYARQFTDAITAGGTLKLISEQMGRVEGSGFAVDLGVQYHNLGGLRGLHMGVAMKNVGPQMSFDGPGLLRRATSSEGSRPEQYYDLQAASFELPSSLEIGVAYQNNVNESLNWTVGGTFVNNNLGLDGYRGGAEMVYNVSPAVQLAGRGGMEYSPTQAGDEQIFGPAVGAGLVWKSESLNITLDYAFRSVEFFDNNNMFSLKFGF